MKEKLLVMKRMMMVAPRATSNCGERESLMCREKVVVMERERSPIASHPDVASSC